jgi:hypothetical protein
MRFDLRRNIVQQPVPLDYARWPKEQMTRYAVVDHSAPLPNRLERPDGSVVGDTYFTETRELVRRGASGQMLKKPRINVTPGAEPGTVSFADTHPWGDDGTYIDYMKTRADQRSLGHAGALVDHIAQQYPGAIHFGRVMSPSVWKMMEGLEAQGRQVHGHRDF